MRPNATGASRSRHSNALVGCRPVSDVHAAFVGWPGGGPITCARVIEEVSRADSAAGWSLQNPLSWAFMCSRLPDGGAEELFARNADVLIAGPFHPPMKAVPVDGGYHVTGRSPLASNCRDANWIGASAMVMDG